MIVVLLALLAFGISLGHEFVWDDLSMFSRPFFLAPVTRPLTELTLWINFQISDHPAGFHAVNLALHCLASWLVLDVLRRVIPERAALTAAAIFAVHPLQAEAVNYVWARANLLMAVFCLLAMRDWLAKRHWRALIWFALALLAKQECVLLPVALLFFDRKWKPAAAMMALAAVVGGYVWWAANTTPGSQAGAQAKFTAMEYLHAQGAVVLRYFASFFVPWDWSLWPIGWLAWLPVLAVGAWRPWGALTLLLLLPSSSVFPANDLVADRRMYLPMLGLCAAVGLALKRGQWIVVALLAILAVRQSLVWSSEQTLWSHVLARDPRSVAARVHLGGVSRLEEAKEIAPADPAVASALGKAYLTSGDPARALAEFGRALALAPNSPEALTNRGAALLALGQTDAARGDFERALRIDPCLFAARLNLRLPPNPGCRYTGWQREALEGKR